LSPAASNTLRLDKWLWHVRVCKTRTLAQKLCTAGHVRLNGAPARKPGAAVRPGDTVMVTIGRIRRTLIIRALGERRGSASEAALLFDEPAQPENLSPLDASAPVHRVRGGGRPTKKDRRDLDKVLAAARESS